MKLGNAYGFISMAAAILVIGACGGGGISPNGRTSPTQATRDAVKMTQASGIRAMLSGGGQNFDQAEAANGQQGGGGTSGGGGIGMPMIGAFINNVATNPGLLILGRGRGDDNGSGTSGGGGIGPDPGGDPTFYYDEFLGLWVETNFTENSMSFLLYEDEAKSQPAGSIVSQWPSDWLTYPQSYTSTFEFTKGAYAGSSGRYETRFESETTGFCTYESNWKGSHDVGQSSWSDEGYNWSNRFENADGYWSADNGTFKGDGTGSTYSENSLGYRTRYEYFADGSARGVIEGPDPGLPVTITWDANGHVRVEYADGTSEEWDWWTICDDVVSVEEGGTSGGSGGTVDANK